MNQPVLPTTVPKPKAVRFAQLVKEAGKPEVITLWADPKKDRAFMELVKKHRVVTIVQKPRGTKKDFGFIGFHPQPFAAFMVFPRQLKGEEGLQIIGIKYELIESPAPGPVKTFKPKILAKPKAIPKEPVEKRFSVQIARTLVQELEFEVTATNVTEAKARGLEQAAEQSLPEQSKKISDKIMRIKPQH